MRVLVLGGSVFLGRAVVEEALRRGDDVTTFNRGRSGPDLPGVEAIRGDREDPADLDRLRGRAWDVVVDTSGYVPQVVGEAAKRLVDTCSAYVFVSSCSASRDWPHAPVTDASPTHACAAGAGPDAGDYGTLKAGCERAVLEVFGAERALIVRAGLILGPYEDVGRLPWWLARISRGGDVLAPGDPARPMQVVDARDLARWMLAAPAAGVGGAFHATGPRGDTTTGGWLAGCVEVTGSHARLVWVDDSFLLDHDVHPWTELPLWMPAGHGADHVWDVDTAAAEATGLRCRPVAETVADTWAWLRGSDLPAGPIPTRHGATHGIEPAKEQAILAAWAARGGSVGGR